MPDHDNMPDHDKSSRRGPFWDVIEGRSEPSGASQLLGFRVLAVEPGTGTARIAFTVDDRFANPVGNVHGGFLAAMLDDTVGSALASTLRPAEFAPTVDLQLQFLRPARPGTFVGDGRIVRRGRDIAFLAGELADTDGMIVATATATSFVRERSRAQSGS